jgi:hypothetical protein
MGGKKKTFETGSPDLPQFEPDERTDEEKEVARLLARDMLQRVRDRCKIEDKPKEMSPLEQALKHPTPNVPSTQLPDSGHKAGDRCRCGLALVDVDWSMHGVENAPPICPKCRNLPRHCTCEGGLF